MTVLGTVILLYGVLVSMALWLMWYVTRPPKSDKEWHDGTKGE